MLLQMYMCHMISTYVQVTVTCYGVDQQGIQNSDTIANVSPHNVSVT